MALPEDDRRDWIAFIIYIVCITATDPRRPCDLRAGLLVFDLSYCALTRLGLIESGGGF